MSRKRTRLQITTDQMLTNGRRANRLPLGRTRRYCNNRLMFTTGLRAGDLAMTGIAGLRPIGQVMGACVSHSDFIHGNGQMTGSPGKVYLYPEAVAAVRTTRKKALHRMTRDAAALGADAVVGIQVSHKERRWDDRDRYGGLERVP